MLKTRVLTSLILAPSFLAALFLLPEPYWSLLMLAAILMGIWEWSDMAKFPMRGRVTYLVFTALLGVTIVFANGADMAYVQEYALFWGILAAALFWILMAPGWLITRYHLRNLVLMAIAGWLMLLPLWLALMSLRRSGALFLLAVIAAIWVADTSAYVIGKRFGRHKLAPQISPGKTWEGVLGAWIGVGIYGFVLCQVFHFDYWIIAGLWVLTVLSIIGDLLESLIKRQAGMKDSGTLLPGHGGMLDRIDGLTSSLPMAALFIYFPAYYTVFLHYV
jgi:phosphatidate cytidylyltransferase